ncbi:hypothetical protein AZE99_13305 [Sphingorhabdus sp. M41]|nr:hypothetical protein AZE99_13305 [Sphingorhabdus sp. M41]
MTFQDEFIHRLRVVRGEATGDGGEDSGPSTGSGRTDERESRHPEFISGPLEAEPEDRGVGDGVLNQVQDDDSMRLQGEESAPDKSVRLERSRETGDGGDVSRLRSTRTGEDDEDSSVRGGELTPPSRLREGPGVGRNETKSAGADTTDTPTPNPVSGGTAPGSST